MSFISKWIPWRDDVPEKTTWKRCLEDIRRTAELFSSHIFLKISWVPRIKLSDSTGSARANQKHPRRGPPRRHTCSVPEQRTRGWDAGWERCGEKQIRLKSQRGTCRHLQGLSAPFIAANYLHNEVTSCRTAERQFAPLASRRPYFSLSGKMSFRLPALGMAKRGQFTSGKRLMKFSFILMVRQAECHNARFSPLRAAPFLLPGLPIGVYYKRLGCLQRNLQLGMIMSGYNATYPIVWRGGSLYRKVAEFTLGILQIPPSQFSVSLRQADAAPHRGLDSAKANAK